MKIRAFAAAAAVSASLFVAGCSSNSTASPSPTSSPSPVSSSPSASAGTDAAPTSGTKTTASSGATTKTDSSGTKASTPAKTTSAPVVVQNPLPSAKNIGNVVAKRKSVVLAACKATGDGWAATGTAVNATAKPVDYTITIFFTTEKATVQDFSVAKVKVAAKSTAKWTATKKFKAATPTLCVLRGVA